MTLASAIPEAWLEPWLG